MNNKIILVWENTKGVIWGEAVGDLVFVFVCFVCVFLLQTSFELNKNTFTTFNSVIIPPKVHSEFQKIYNSRFV